MMAEPSSQVISAFLRISRENGKLNHGLAVSLGLADSDMWVLYILHEAKEPLTPKEMSVTWSFSKQTLHSSLFKLEKAGYLLIEMSSENRKNRWVSLTKTGEEFHGHSCPLCLRRNNVPLHGLLLTNAMRW
jgi:DNA-binding MarR family transcriptional regulator